MMFEIIKPQPSTEAVVIDKVAVKSALVTGMKNGTIRKLHDAVTIATTIAGVSLDGNKVEPFFKTLLTELKMLDSLADQLAKEGKLINEIISELEKVTDNFLITDIRDYKIEVYGSIAEWKQAMISNDTL